MNPGIQSDAIDLSAAAQEKSLPVYQHIVNIMRQRVEEGHYTTRAIPTINVLAEEFGVSVMTMRGVIQLLSFEGVLRRKGRFELVPTRPARNRLNLALLTPAFPSGLYRPWFESLSAVAGERNAEVRLIPYRNWVDPIIAETVASFDAVFLIPRSGDVPEGVLRPLLKKNKPLVSLIYDLTVHGWPSIRPLSSRVVPRLMDHLAERGHRRLACFNIQRHEDPRDDRVAEWRAWMDRRGWTGPCWDHPFAPESMPRTSRDGGFDRYPLDTARAVAATWDSAGRGAAGLPFTGLFATTAVGAFAMMRALREAGVAVGRDVAVVAVEGERFAEYACPPLTTVDSSELERNLGRVVDWIRAGTGDWEGPLLLEPADAEVTVRESSDFHLR